MPRTKDFDEHKILQKIQDVFWTNGFYETSLSDLTRSTGLAKMSLYNCFGNKEEMFVKSLELYDQNSKLSRNDQERGLNFLFKCIENFADLGAKGKAKKGCFIMNSALELASDKGTKAKISSQCWSSVEKKFKEALTQAVEDKEIKAETDVEALSKWLISQVFVIRQFSKFIKDKEYFDQIKFKSFDVLNEAKLKKDT